MADQRVISGRKGGQQGGVMMEQRVMGERRTNDGSMLAKVHDRVFNGLSKEIREEVAKEIDKVNAKLWAVLASLFIALIGIVITIGLTSTSRSMENERTYRAIVDIGSQLENHIITTMERP
jgi:hypothetical protein